MKIAIKGVGVVGGFGCGMEQLHHSLVKGKSAPTTISIKTIGGVIVTPALLADTSRLIAFVDKKALRRTDHYTRLALLGCYLALQDAAMLDQQRKRMGIIVATGYGATCNVSDFRHPLTNGDDLGGSPTRFSNSAHNAAAANIAISLNEKGPNLSINDYDMSMPAAVLTACQWLEEGRADAVLVGGVDEYCHAMGYYRHRLNGKEGGELSIPREYAIIGEGAVFFYLSLQGNEPAPYGYIEDVQMGRYGRTALRVPENSVFLTNTDGYSGRDHEYANILGPQTRTASYTPLYGGIPVGLGFDMALAALSLRNNAFYPSAESVLNRSTQENANGRIHALEDQELCCLKLGARGTLGMVTLSG